MTDGILILTDFISAVAFNGIYSRTLNIGNKTGMTDVYLCSFGSPTQIDDITCLRLEILLGGCQGITNVEIITIGCGSFLAHNLTHYLTH